MRILFCGSQVPEEIEYQIRDISAAGNRFQNNFVANLRKLGHEVTLCSYIGVPVPEEIKQKLKDNIVFKDMGFLKSLLKYRKQVMDSLDDNDLVICYNIIYAWIFLPFWAHRKNKRCIAIIADYREAVSYTHIIGKVYALLQGISMRYFDSIIGLSANIKGRLQTKQPFTLMEGGIDRGLYDALESVEQDESAPITFLYSGLLDELTGVDKLLELMKRVSRSDIRLLVSGRGALEHQVKQAAEEDARICYLGHLPYDEYVKQLGRTDVLINPRNMEFPENLNNFPSKVMDYLAAGKVIISTKFAGWERFHEYITFCDTYEEMAEVIDSINLDGREETFFKNREFAREFLWEEQIRKNIGMVKDVE